MNPPSRAALSRLASAARSAGTRGPRSSLAFATPPSGAHPAPRIPNPRLGVSSDRRGFAAASASALNAPAAPPPSPTRGSARRSSSPRAWCARSCASGRWTAITGRRASSPRARRRSPAPSSPSASSSPSSTAATRPRSTPASTSRANLTSRAPSASRPAPEVSTDPRCPAPSSSPRSRPDAAAAAPSSSIADGSPRTGKNPAEARASEPPAWCVSRRPPHDSPRTTSTAGGMDRRPRHAVAAGLPPNTPMVQLVHGGEADRGNAAPTSFPAPVALADLRKFRVDPGDHINYAATWGGLAAATGAGAAWALAGRGGGGTAAAAAARRVGSGASAHTGRGR